MRIRSLLAALALLLALPLLTSGATAATATATEAARTQPTITVDGAVDTPLTLSVADLRRFPAQRALVRFTSGGNPEIHFYRGVLLTDVLAAAAPAFDPGVRNDALRHAVLVTATDGYQAVVAWGEIDPTFAGTRVLLAYEEDRRPLARPRLVVPGDERGGRYVTDVVAVTLLRVGA